MLRTQTFVTMALPPPVLPSAGTPAQLRKRAAEYRQMAKTARMDGSADALLRLAARFDALAEQEEQMGAPRRGASGAADSPR